MVSRAELSKNVTPVRSWVVPICVPSTNAYRFTPLRTTATWYQVFVEGVHEKVRLVLPEVPFVEPRNVRAVPVW